MDKNKNIVRTEKLSKIYKVHYREKAGLFSSLKSLVIRKYKKVAAVHEMDMLIRSGEIWGLIGPNGAGKSTTIKMFSGILYPTSGHAEIMGYIPWKQREQLVKKIGVVFGQKSQMYWDLPAIDTFQLHRKIYDIPNEIYNHNITYFTKLLSVGDVINRPVRQLSLGERMKCEFICALLHEPPLVFLDEPTIGLDIFSKEAIRTFIKGVNKEKGITFIVTTHDLNDIENLCDYVSIMNKGVIIFNDRLEELKGYFANKKIVELQFRQKIDRSTLIGYSVKDFTPLTANIEIDTSKAQLDQEVAKIFKQLPVKDININNISIEEVIKFVYAQENT